MTAAPEIPTQAAAAPVSSVTLRTTSSTPASRNLGHQRVRRVRANGAVLRRAGLPAGTAGRPSAPGTGGTAGLPLSRRRDHRVICAVQQLSRPSHKAQLEHASDSCAAAPGPVCLPEPVRCQSPNFRNEHSYGSESHVTISVTGGGMAGGSGLRPVSHCRRVRRGWRSCGTGLPASHASSDSSTSIALRASCKISVMVLGRWLTAALALPWAIKSGNCSGRSSTVSQPGRHQATPASRCAWTGRS